MTPDEIATARKMTTVKAACARAPAGPKKDAALDHYRAAEQAHMVKDDAGTNRELDEASACLSPYPVRLMAVAPDADRPEAAVVI